jgi:hypothetical protein
VDVKRIGIVRCRIGLLMGTLCFASACSAQEAAKGQPIFKFHSGFWVNLHQFLHAEATASDAPRSDSPEWRRAVEYYRLEIVRHPLLSDELAAVNNRLSEAGSASELRAVDLEPGLAATLTQAAPIYRHAWWPQHNRSNLEWIDAVQPLIAKHGAAIAKDIAAAYRVDWPAKPIRTDVSAYAGPNGAYTTVMPVHITISSADRGYQGMAALEMLFHEASHTLDEKIRQALTRELDVSSKLFRRRGFEHAILFYTAGEMTRRYVANYEPYGIKNGTLERGWPGSLAVLEKDWKPYLEGRTNLAAALHAIVADYGVPKNAP